MLSSCEMVLVGTFGVTSGFTISGNFLTGSSLIFEEGSSVFFSPTGSILATIVGSSFVTSVIGALDFFGSSIATSTSGVFLPRLNDVRAGNI